MLQGVPEDKLGVQVEAFVCTTIHAGSHVLYAHSHVAHTPRLNRNNAHVANQSTRTGRCGCHAGSKLGGIEEAEPGFRPEQRRGDAERITVCAQEADARTLGAVAELPCVDESIGYGIRAQSRTCLFGVFGSYSTDNGAMPDPRRMLNDTLFGGTEIASIPMTAIPEGRILESELEDYNLELHRKTEEVERRLLEFFPTF